MKTLWKPCQFIQSIHSALRALALPQVALSAPATDLTSVQVQWRAGDPSTGTDQNALPLALSIEASVDGGKEWHGITGGDEAVDVALAHKASPGSSQHRYPVSLLALRRKT